MSTDREKRRAARQKAAHRRTEPDAAPAGQTAVRSKPVRITIDLTPEMYRRFTRWTNETALELDFAKLPQAQVVRAFIQMLDDPQVEEQVRQTLRAMRDMQ
jgi:hypothetical protein